MPKVHDIVRRVRGLIGVTGLGGLAGAGLGAVMAALRSLTGSGLPWADVLGLATGGLLYGGACGLGFGLVLLAIDSRRSLLELPLWRMGVFGAALGAGVPAVYMLLTSGLFHFLYAPGIVASVTGTGAALGGLVAASMVALAQRAERAEIAQVEEVMALLGDDSLALTEEAP